MFADEKTVVFTFSQIQQTTATVNVSGNGEGITATVRQATHTANNTPTNYFTSGAGYRENVLGVNYGNAGNVQNNYWEIPFTITGLPTDIEEYTITTELVLLNSGGDKQANGTVRTWIETIYVNGTESATSGNVAMSNGNASSVNRIFNLQTPTNPLDLTVRMQKTDGAGCFAGIKSITLSYFEEEKVYDEYRVDIKGENVSGLQVVMSGERSAKRTNIASDGEYLRVKTNQTPKAVDFKLIGSDLDNKFVWGPVIDKRMMTITFGISNKATDLQTGFYQLMLKDNADIDKANNLISKFAENENTASNYLYLAPSVYHLDDAKFKFTGTPTYGNETATYVYIKKNDNNTVDITGVGGAEFQGLAYSFSNGEITFTGYGIKNYTDKDNQNTIKYEPKEMPSLVSGTGPTTYALNAVSLTDCDAYYIEYAGKYSDQTRFTYKKATPTGISNYGNNELFIVSKPLTRAVAGLDESDFVSDDAICTKVEIIKEPSDTIPGKIRLTIEAATVEYEVVIAGDARQESDRVVYNNHDYANGQTVSVPVSAMPSALDFKTNVTNRFVWGPIFDHEAKTVTFEVYNPITNLTTSGAGWYQLQVTSASHITTINNKITGRASNINTPSNYIYNFSTRDRGKDDGSSYYLMKYSGIPTYGDEATTFIYLEPTSATQTYIQSPNGHYAINTGEARRDKTSATYRINGSYFDVERWVESGATDWDEAPASAAGSGYNENIYLHKVDISKYGVYKVVLEGYNATEPNCKNDLMISYVGSSHNYGLATVYNNGYFFLDSDAAPTLADFRLSAQIYKVTGITISAADDNGIKTITLSTVSLVDGYNN